MFKFNRLGCVLLLCTCAGIAYAGANKISSFTPTVEETELADGMAILNYVTGQNKTIVQIIIGDFTANESYDIEFVGVGTFFDQFITDEKGHATFHDSFPGDISGSDINLRVDGVLRAVGTQGP